MSLSKKKKQKGSQVLFGLFFNDKLVFNEDGKPIISTNANDVYHIGLTITPNNSVIKTVRQVKVKWDLGNSGHLLTVIHQNHLPSPDVVEAVDEDKRKGRD